MADSFSPFWRETTVPPRVEPGRDAVERRAGVLRLDGEQHQVERRRQAVGRDGPDRCRPDAVRRHDGEAALVHGQDVVGRLIDQQHVVPGARQRCPRDPADRTRPDDRDSHAPLSITGPRERQRDGPVGI